MHTHMKSSMTMLSCLVNLVLPPLGRTRSQPGLFHSLNMLLRTQPMSLHIAHCPPWWPAETRSRDSCHMQPLMHWCGEGGGGGVRALPSSTATFSSRELALSTPISLPGPMQFLSIICTNSSPCHSSPSSDISSLSRKGRIKNGEESCHTGQPMQQGECAGAEEQHNHGPLS